MTPEEFVEALGTKLYGKKKDAFFQEQSCSHFDCAELSQPFSIERTQTKKRKWIGLCFAILSLPFSRLQLTANKLWNIEKLKLNSIQYCGYAVT